MIVLKDDSIELDALHPALALALSGTVSPILAKLGHDTTITSGNEQTAWHGKTSLHYIGCAVDIRTHDPVTGELLYNAVVVVKAIKNALNCDFDVVLEDDHIHIEYQPKRRASQ